jgi:hypothetical protein
MTKPLFTFRDAWPWAVLALAAIAACVLVWIAKGAQVYHGIITFAAAGGALGLVWLHFWTRWKVVDAWNRAPKLWQDVAVLSPITLEQLDAIEDAPMVVTNLATDWAACRSVKGGRDKVFAAIRGCYVTFMPASWKVGGKYARGSQQEEHIMVIGPEVEGIEITRSLIIHELSHRALTALGIPAIGIGENHHKIFKEEGLGC